MLKCLTVWITKKKKMWKILKEMRIPDHFTCLLRNVYAGQEATVRTGCRMMHWFQIGKGLCKGCMLSLCLFNLHVGFIMWNAGLDEAQAGIKIAGGNINNLRYSDDSTLMVESEEELKSFLVKVKESEKLAWNSTFQKQRSWCPITSWQIVGENMETVMDYFLGLQNQCKWWLQPWN